MTIRDVYREMAIARQREAREFDRDVRLAWYTVRLYAEWRTKKLPALASLLDKTPVAARPRQSIADQHAALHTLAKMFGGRVRPMRT